MKAGSVGNSRSDRIISRYSGFFSLENADRSGYNHGMPDIENDKGFIPEPTVGTPITPTKTILRPRSCCCACVLAPILGLLLLVFVSMLEPGGFLPMGLVPDVENHDIPNIMQELAENGRWNGITMEPR